MKFLHRSGSILLPPVQGASRSLLILLLSFLFLLTTPKLQAIHDTNQNGVSDLWEKKFYNGQLASNFDPTADPDGDGWTNAQEATAGTDPVSGIGLTGLVRPEVTNTSGVVTITWPTVDGKKYSLQSSPDLAPGSWTQVDEPLMGYGSAITKSFNPARPDGTMPERNFWRVTVTDQDIDSDTLTNSEEAELGTSPYSSDGDKDGLSDIAELFTQGTNPISSDTDADGVSDGDEILVNFTSANNSFDSDGDNIPDDFERHLARQLLAYRPSPAAWGAFHAGLVVGNLDPTYDYTGDGMTALELTQTLKNIAAVGHSRSGFLVEQQHRETYLSSTYYYTPPNPYYSPYTASYYHTSGGPPNYTRTELKFIPTADLSEEYLTSRIDAELWYQLGITWPLTDYYRIHAGSSFNSWQGTNDLNYTYLINYINAIGSISQRRLHLIATDVGHKEESITFLKASGDTPNHRDGGPIRVSYPLSKP